MVSPWNGLSYVYVRVTQHKRAQPPSPRRAPRDRPCSLSRPVVLAARWQAIEGRLGKVGADLAPSHGQIVSTGSHRRLSGLIWATLVQGAAHPHPSLTKACSGSSLLGLTRRPPRSTRRRMLLTVDWTTPSSTAISSCVLPSSRSALALAIRGSSIILGTVSSSRPSPFRALIATSWLCQEISPRSSPDRQGKAGAEISKSAPDPKG
jgi:hypothetical protein